MSAIFCTLKHQHQTTPWKKLITRLNSDILEHFLGVHNLGLGIYGVILCNMVHWAYYIYTMNVTKYLVTAACYWLTHCSWKQFIYNISYYMLFNYRIINVSGMCDSNCMFMTMINMISLLIFFVDTKKSYL